MGPTIGEVIAVLEEAVLCEPGRITEATDLAEVPYWDSNSAVYFVGEALGRWGAELSMEDLRDCRYVRDLAARIAQRRSP